MGLGEEGRRVPVARVLIAFPMISGVFFGILSAALVSPLGGFGRATEVGLLVGGVMFTANAAALCIVQASAWDDDRRPKEAPERSPALSEVRAS